LLGEIFGDLFRFDVDTLEARARTGESESEFESAAPGEFAASTSIAASGRRRGHTLVAETRCGRSALRQGATASRAFAERDMAANAKEEEVVVAVVDAVVVDAVAERTDSLAKRRSIVARAS
jgi:hypothetical protein